MRRIDGDNGVLSATTREQGDEKKSKRSEERLGKNYKLGFYS